jgi:hypothetical protein
MNRRVLPRIVAKVTVLTVKKISGLRYEENDGLDEMTLMQTSVCRNDAYPKPSVCLWYDE